MVALLLQVLPIWVDLGAVLELMCFGLLLALFGIVYSLLFYLYLIIVYFFSSFTMMAVKLVVVILGGYKVNE